MLCNSCNKPSDWLERINPKGVDGIFYCADCLRDHLAAIEELKAMTPEELELVEYTIVKWCCQAKNCRGHTKVRDYGIAPQYWHPRKSIQWFDVNQQFWMCSKHYKLFKRLSKKYSFDHIYRRLFNTNKHKIQPLK